MQEMSNIAKQNFPEVIAELGNNSPLKTPLMLLFHYLNISIKIVNL